jgi:TctA family transporter
MTFFAPVVARFALDFGPSEICSLMLLGLLAASTLARGSPLKGVAMTLFGQMLGVAGVDMNTGVPRFTFGFINLYDGVELVALALGLFGIAEFLKSVNRIAPLHLGPTRPCGQTLPRCGCIRARRIPRSWWQACHIGWRCGAAP